MFVGRGNGLGGVGLRGERDEGDVGDLVDGLAANLRDLLARGYRDEEEGSRDFEEAWRLLVPRGARDAGPVVAPMMPCASSDIGVVSSSRLSFSSGPTFPL
jgi:hypothetical protein